MKDNTESLDEKDTIACTGGKSASGFYPLYEMPQNLGVGHWPLEQQGHRFIHCS